MNSFLYSKRIQIAADQNLADVKEFLKTTLSSSMDISEIGPDPNHFTLQGTTGSIFDFVRRANVSAEFTMTDDAPGKNGKEVRIIVSGSASITYSLIMVYLILFFFIMAVGLLPGSIETNGEKSDALDALVFLLIGLYIKIDIDKGLKDAAQNIHNTVNVLETRFGV